jgi:hypothetical protein
MAVSKRKSRTVLLLLTATSAFLSCARTELSGEFKTWHRLSLTVTGPETGESDSLNPFLDYRLIATFSRGERTVAVPGYYAADGRAAESGASVGNKWRVHFMPDATGLWNYSISFRKGKKIALTDDPEAGEPLTPDGEMGSLMVAPSDKTGDDFRARGHLRYVGKRYLQFAESGEFYLKGGADSPENFLAYYEFDQADRIMQTREEARDGEANKRLDEGLHRYEPHAGDWKAGDPTWRNGRGKNIIGALNYLASKGMNSVYFLTMNVAGDGDDVWPWTDKEERYRFDVSKLDQWEIVFSHMDKLGLLLHVITQETENDQLLDGGDLGPERMLYYRELIARFVHHPALVWNLGEENTNTDEQRMAFAEYLHARDPYDHPVVVHTYPGQYDSVYRPLLGFDKLQGPSLQMGNQKYTHDETLKWIERSADAGYPWFVCLDEIGPAETGVKPDKDDYWHDDVRYYSLWGNLMAGGSGCEWYFGYRFDHNDLSCEDWRSRDFMWDLTRFALDFFRKHLPFQEMDCRNDLTTAKGDYCFAKPGEVYAIYLPPNTSTRIDVDEGSYIVSWYNPRAGGDLLKGSIESLTGPGRLSLGDPPADRDRDWVVLVKRSS